jgi:hypothetical protein
MGVALPAHLRADHLAHDLLAWAVYALIMWIFIALFAGLKRLLAWLCAAFILAFTLVASGVLMSESTWQFLLQNIPGLGGTPSEPDMGRQLELLMRLFTVSISVPYAIFFMSSFSAAGLFKAAMRRSGPKRMNVLVCLAILLRMFQHVHELIEAMLLAWREENPNMVVPRHRTDSFVELLRWYKWSLYSWCCALLARTFMFVPVVASEWQSFMTRNSQT